jgi:restriction system protein
MLPLLRATGDGEEHRTRELLEPLADEFHLSVEDRERLLASGTQRVFENRVYWGVVYLKKAGLLEGPRRGYIRITAAGREVLAKPPERIDIAYLSRYPTFVAFKSGGPRPETDIATAVAASTGVTPEEEIESTWLELRRGLADDLLNKVKASPPAFFERLVVKLLVEMGYGGSLKDAGKAIGRSGDGGLDGVIKEDKLGLDLIYLQAKRWDATVGRPQVQAFAGSLEGVHATRGVMITTSTFSHDAREYVGGIGKRIVLVDGRELADLMIDHGIGVTPLKSYALHRIDEDYFEAD